MDFYQFLAFLAVISVLVMSPGPNGALLAQVVPVSGRNSGFAVVAGFTSAVLFHGGLFILGLSALLFSSPTSIMIVKYLGATYLIGMGLKSLWSVWNSKAKGKAVTSHEPKGLTHSYWSGFVTNGLNPKVSMFYLFAFPQFLPQGGNIFLLALGLILLHSLMITTWFSGVVVVFSRLKVMSKQNSQIWLTIITGLIFIGFGIKLLTYHPPV